GNTRMIIFDQRWIGDHGIGRFARELFKSNIGKKCIKLNNKPTSIFDVFILTKYLCSDKNIYCTPGYNSPLLFLKRSVITV
ncbi:glycosyltransferase family 1 protein, partial [Klebsiella pneumoniae]